MEVPGLGDHVWLVPCLSLLSQHVPGSMLPSKLLKWTEPDEERCLCNAVRARSCTLFLQTFLLLVDSDSLLFLLRLLSHMPVCLSSPVGGPPSRLPCLPSPTLLCSQTPSSLSTFSLIRAPRRSSGLVSLQVEYLGVSGCPPHSGPPR